MFRVKSTNKTSRFVFLRSDQFEALTCVQYRWWEPVEFDSLEASQADAADPQHIHAAAPQHQLHHGVRHPGIVHAPVVGEVAPGRQVQRVVTPVFGDSIRGRDQPAPLRPLDVAAGVAVILHPLRGEVPELRRVPQLHIRHPGQCGSLHGHVHLHLLHLPHPRRRVGAVQHQNEARAEAAVLLLPPVQKVPQAKSISSWWTEKNIGKRRIRYLARITEEIWTKCTR